MRQSVHSASGLEDGPVKSRVSGAEILCTADVCMGFCEWSGERPSRKVRWRPIGQSQDHFRGLGRLDWYSARNAGAGSLPRTKSGVRGHLGRAPAGRRRRVASRCAANCGAAVAPSGAPEAATSRTPGLRPGQGTNARSAGCEAHRSDNAIALATHPAPPVRGQGRLRSRIRCAGCGTRWLRRHGADLPRASQRRAVGARDFTRASKSVSGSDIRPVPTVRQACQPSSGPTS